MLIPALYVLAVPSSAFSPPGRTWFPAHSRPTTPNRRAQTAGTLFASAEADSLDNYASDLAVVLKELRGEELDPTLPALWRKSRELSFTTIWTDAEWSRHNSRWRFVDFVTSFPTSRLLRRISPQLFVLVAWSSLATWLCSNKAGFFSFSLPLTPLSILSTFVAALLTLRSNQGLNRLNEGRTAFGKVILYTRDISQIIAAAIYPKDKQLGLKLARHVSLFGWLLKNFLRGNSGVDDDIVRAMLPQADADYVLRQRKKPVAVIARLRQICTHMAEEGKLSTAEEIALDHTTQALNHCVMTCERIKASPIPTLYTAHAGRLLMFYLFFLPLALKGTNMLSDVGTVIASAAVGFAMIGLDEISHLMEQPFRLMPLYQLCKNSMTDVGDAFVCQPPPLEAEMNEGYDGYKDPPYWQLSGLF